MRYSKFKDAKAAGCHFGVHVLNQADKADNGWHYFPTREEASTFRDTHSDPLNHTTIDQF